MLSQILAWWWRQIASLLPARFRRAGRPDAMIVAIDRMDEAAAPSGAILIRRGGVERFRAPLRLAADRLPGPRMPTALRLPAGMVLRREVVLPLAAERDLASVIAFEMDRLTPFAPEEVFWGLSGLRRDPVRGLRMTLLIALRAPVERLLETLASANLKPGFLEDGDGRIPLSQRFALPGRRLNAALYGLSAFLALACLAIPLIRQQLALNAVQAEIADLQPAAHEAMALRQRLAIAASGQAAIAAAQQSGDALQSLAALTAALPDGTFLSDFTLKSGDLTIDGRSTDAARLIAMLAAAPGFHDPRFVAPVTRAIDGQADLFSIHATVGP
jgi:general secretion pathway protein L